MPNIFECRLCLKSCRNKIHVFKDDFPKMIEILTGIKVEPYDNFPKHSCLDCAKNVKLALRLKKQIINSHRILLERFLKESQGCDSFNTNNIEFPKHKIRNCQKTPKSDEKNADSVNKDDQENDNSNSFDSSSHSSNTEWSPNENKCIKNEPSFSEEIFFVKKTRSHRIPTTSETVVRLKKKPKVRIPPKRVTCEVCKREVQSYWLQKHMETHQYNPVTCEFCGLVSKSATALRHHVFYYHRSAADEYMCDQCAKSFRSKYKLNLHKKKEHGGTKDFECTTCGKQFFERMHLKRHVDKTHKNIRPYVCDFCGKTFKSKNHIKIHERIHSKEAPYNCHLCGESFKMKLTLRSHLKGVHNIHEAQNVFCPQCKRGFVSDVALKAHLNSRIHETEKCQHCSEMFTREYMVNHLRDVHGAGESSTHPG